MMETISQNSIPYKTLYTGDKMPCIGMGTFGSDRFSHEEVAKAVEGAAKIGYRLFDCASVYGNEDKIGKSIRVMLDNGIKRTELFIQSKVWNDKHDDVVNSCKKSLKDLGLDYIDAYFVHWPFPNYHPPGCTVDSRSPDAKPYIHENFMNTWRQMESLVEMGMVRNLGTSNVTIPKLKLILRDAKIKPALNEMELHPSFQQSELYDYCIKNNIQPVGFCPIGSPTRPDRDKSPDDVVDIEMDELKNIAAVHNCHPAVICLKWAVQRGQIPIPFSIHENEYTSNLKCVTEGPLTEEEMKIMVALDKNCRFIKGHVFLWERADDWYDLWDINGTITK
jgi:alcohol dehydrogenase (NADP+)